MGEPFERVIGSEGELRSVYQLPGDLVCQKLQPRLDRHARAFIGLAPFVLIGTASPDGTGDVSPKDGPPGFVAVLDDEHLAVPDLSGNNLLDSISNIVNGSGVGLLFMVPGVDETLRVNGHACVTTDPGVLDTCAVKDRRPKAAIGVTVAQQYMHCGKAFRRSGLWRTDEWPERSTLPSLATVLHDQMAGLSGLPVQQIDQMLESDYAATMWEPGGAR
jgi:PPOX class probable FMN-dependent enzyme